MGGSIAIDFTLQYPELVKDLILSGPSLNGYNPIVDDESKLRSVAIMSIARRDKDFNKSVEFLLDNAMWKQSNPRAQQHLKNMLLDTSLEWALEDIEKTAIPMHHKDSRNYQKRYY